MIWPHGLEIFPNLKGRYLHIVSDYRDPPYTQEDDNAIKINFCTIIVTGTRYVRNFPIETTQLIVNKGESLVVPISHVESELIIANELVIDVR